MMASKFILGAMALAASSTAGLSWAAPQADARDSMIEQIRVAATNAAREDARSYLLREDQGRESVEMATLVPDRRIFGPVLRSQQMKAW